MRPYISETYFEDGEQLGYYYQLVKGNIFWKGYFYTNGRRNRINASISLSISKHSARKKLLRKISDYHFGQLEMMKGAKYDRFRT